MVAHIENLETLTSLRYIGNLNNLNPHIENQVGDITIIDNSTYCWDGVEWQPFGTVTAYYEPKINPRRIISHCPQCGGPVTEISDHAMYSGYQPCEWCMSMINIYEKEVV